MHQRLIVYYVFFNKTDCEYSFVVFLQRQQAQLSLTKGQLDPSTMESGQDQTPPPSGHLGFFVLVYGMTRGRLRSFAVVCGMNRRYLRSFVVVCGHLRLFAVVSSCL